MLAPPLCKATHHHCALLQAPPIITVPSYKLHPSSLCPPTSSTHHHCALLQAPPIITVPSYKLHPSSLCPPTSSTHHHCVPSYKLHPSSLCPPTSSTRHHCVELEGGHALVYWCALIRINLPDSRVCCWNSSQNMICLHHPIF